MRVRRWGGGAGLLVLGALAGCGGSGGGHPADAASSSSAPVTSAPPSFVPPPVPSVRPTTAKPGLGDNAVTLKVTGRGRVDITYSLGHEHDELKNVRLPWKMTGYPDSPGDCNVQASAPDMSSSVTCRVYRGYRQITSNRGYIALCMHIPGWQGKGPALRCPTSPSSGAGPSAEPSPSEN
ncbi:hypothetical protein AB0L06_24030 [Spirillospora sp. NPDC052269]